MKNALKTLNLLIQPAPRFQRAVNLKYDISASDTITLFIQKKSLNMLLQTTQITKQLGHRMVLRCKE